MDNSIEVRYAGVVVGRALVRDLGQDDGAGTFVGIAEPMPVGTAVTLKIGDVVREARVDEVIESSDPAVVGMRVRWGGVAATAPVKVAPVQSAPVAPMPATTSMASEPVAEAATVESDANAVDEGADASAAIAAPLSLAGPSGDGAQHGGGKRRRKRR